MNSIAEPVALSALLVSVLAVAMAGCAGADSDSSRRAEPNIGDPDCAPAQATAALAQLQSARDSFEDIAQLADVTPRVALYEPIRDMQRIQHEVSTNDEVPDCAFGARRRLASIMDSYIEVYVLFLAEDEIGAKEQLATVNSAMDIVDEDFTNLRRQADGIEGSRPLRLNTVSSIPIPARRASSPTPTVPDEVILESRMYNGCAGNLAGSTRYGVDRWFGYCRCIAKAAVERYSSFDYIRYLERASRSGLGEKDALEKMLDDMGDVSSCY